MKYLYKFIADVDYHDISDRWNGHDLKISFIESDNFVEYRTKYYDAPIEYIENTSNSRINTLVKGNGAVKVECVMMAITKNANWNCAWGARNSPKSYDGIYIYSINNANATTGYVAYNNAEQSNFAAAFTTLNTKYTLLQNRGSFYKNGSLVKAFTNANFESTGYIYIFDSGTGSAGGAAGFPGLMKLYSFTIHINEDLKRNFIPCRVGNTGYLFDSVSRALFANVGGGEFILGEDINLPYDKEIEYLQSNGTQYIDTKYKTNNIDSFELICDVDATTGYMGSNGNLQMDLSTEVSQNRRIIKVVHSPNNGPITYVNDVQIKSEAYHTYNNYIITLFAIGWGEYDAKYYNNTVTIYSAKLIINNITVRDFIPVRIGTTGYMYDKISKQLFGNLGTGNFILGTDK